MTTQSSIFAWEIPWTKEPGGLGVRYDLVAKQQQQQQISLVSPSKLLLLPMYLCLFLEAKKPIL